MDIDCDPFIHQQENIARYIFEDILKRRYQAPSSCFFGNWHWDIELNDKERKEVFDYLRSQYDAGRVRYAAVGVA